MLMKCIAYLTCLPWRCIAWWQGKTLVFQIMLIDHGCKSPTPRHSHAMYDALVKEIRALPETKHE